MISANSEEFNDKIADKRLDNPTGLVVKPQPASPLMGKEERKQSLPARF
jgi:hypothetical protein